MALHDLVNRLQRAAQVLAHRRARGGLVAAVDGGEDSLVVGEDCLALAGRGQVKLAQAVQMAQVVHFLWPPFLFGGLYRQRRRVAEEGFDRLLHNLPFLAD